LIQIPCPCFVRKEGFYGFPNTLEKGRTPIGFKGRDVIPLAAGIENGWLILVLPQPKPYTAFEGFNRLPMLVKQCFEGLNLVLFYA
jgi:hypothetical protein